MIPPKNEWIISLSLIVLLSLGIQGAEAVDYIAGTEFQSRVGGGFLTFTFNFSVTTTTFVSDLVVFSNFTNDDGSFGPLGFDIPTGINVSVSNVEPNTITQTMTYTGIALYRVYTPDHGIPTTVTGTGDIWSWTNGTTIAIIVEDNDVIILEWSSWYDEGDDYSRPTSILPNLINQYLPVGDIAGFIISPYTMTMGIMFFPLVLLMFAIPAQQRLGVTVTGVIVILAWTTIEAALFPEAINLVNIIIRIAIAGGLVYLFYARRRPIG